MPMKKSEDRRERLLQNPAMYRRALLTIIASLGLLLVLFGFEALHGLMLEVWGVSVLSRPLRALNSSISLKVLMLLLWGWWLFDFALQGGIALSMAPYRRLAAHLRRAPATLDLFVPREGDEKEFLSLVNEVNALFSRMEDQKRAIRRCFIEAGASVEQTRRIERILGEVP